jgi:hypothetical protein
MLGAGAEIGDGGFEGCGGNVWGTVSPRGAGSPQVLGAGRPSLRQHGCWLEEKVR